jgi:hypothetical protein
MMKIQEISPIVEQFVDPFVTRQTNPSTTRRLFQKLSLMAILSVIGLTNAYADVGTANSYNPPYLPTTCYGNNTNQLPGGNRFALAGEGIWDNGASCGRYYIIRCLSGDTANLCKSPAIQVKIVGRARTDRYLNRSQKSVTMVLSSQAMRAIANRTNTEINIEYAER